MVNVLMRMKLSALRHFLVKDQGESAITGLSLGLLLAGATLYLSALQFPRLGISGDLLAALLALWSGGWLLAPFFTGGGDQTLRPEIFRFLPLKPRELAWGLLGAAHVGLAPLISLLAFASLLVYAFPRGVLPVIVALPSCILQLALVLVLSRLLANLMARLMQTHLGSIMMSLIVGLIMALTASGWALVPSTSQLLENGFPYLLSLGLHILPSGWGVVTIDAAVQGNWLLVIAALLGQIILLALLVEIWSRSLVRQMRVSTSLSATTKSVQQTEVRPSSSLKAAIAKEWKLAIRDPMRMHYLSFALFYALFFCALPLAVGVWAEIPWMGVIAALVASFSANLYGTDGTSLWLTMMTPGALRTDVRAKQGVWLLLVAPLALILTAIAITFSGQHWTWPWALAFVASFLGGAPGLMVLISVFKLIPRPDPQLRGKGNMLETGSDFGQSFIMLILVPLTALPALAVLIPGAMFDNLALQWAAVGMGILAGAFFYWYFGWLAYRRLETHGSELLHLMRSGSRSRSSSQAARLSEIPLGPRALVTFCFTFCWILLVPQGIVPMIFKLSGNPEKVWFLALYLEEAYQWPTIVSMMALGAGLIVLGWYVYQKHKKQGNDMLKGLFKTLEVISAKTR